MITFVFVNFNQFFRIWIFVLCMGLGLFIPLHGQVDTSQNLRFGFFGDFYSGKNLLLKKNTDVGLDDLVSHHKLGELSVNTAIVTADYSENRVRFSGGLGMGSYFLKNLANEPIGFRNVFQCYGGVKLVNSKSIWLDVGIIPSHIGYESAISMDQPTLTRSLVSDFSPYYEAGLKLSGKYKRISASILQLNGWQRMWRTPNDIGLHLGSQISYQGDKLFLNYSGYYGGLNQELESERRIFHNIYGIYSVTEHMKIWLLLDFGHDDVGRNAKDWWGSAAVIQYKLNNQFSFSGRFERFKDLNNRIVVSSVNSADLTGSSVNVDYNFSEKVLIRAEVKQLSSAKPMFYNQHSLSFSNSSILAIGSIAWKITN